MFDTRIILYLEQFVNLEEFYEDSEISTRKNRPETWQIGRSMPRSLSPQDLNDLNTNITLITYYNIPLDTQGYYPNKKQFYIYKGI